MSCSPFAAVEGAASAAISYEISNFTGACYGWGDFGRDFAIGAVGGAAGAWLGKLAIAGRFGKGAGGAKGILPHGFASFDEFAEFDGNLHSGLAKAGYADTKAILQGSAVTGKSLSTGAPFDVGRVSDFDVALVVDSIFQAAKSAGIPLRSAGTRKGPLNEVALRQLGLFDLSAQMRSQVGRSVNFMIYQTASSATKRAPSILIPR